MLAQPTKGNLDSVKKFWSVISNIFAAYEFKKKRQAIEEEVAKQVAL